jgi:hypothetical protein
MTDADTEAVDEAAERADADGELSFEEGISRAAAEFDKTKRRRYELPGGGHWTFEIRKLTGEQREQVEDAAVTVQQTRNDADVEVDSRAIKRELIRHGVVDGPDGFKTTDRHIDKLLENHYEVGDQLADDIENFSELPEDDEQGF